MQRPRVQTPVEPVFSVLVVLTAVTFIGDAFDTVADFAFIASALGVKLAKVIRSFLACSKFGTVCVVFVAWITKSQFVLSVL